MNKIIRAILSVLDVGDDTVSHSARHNACSSTAVRVVHRERWHGGGGSGYILGMLVTTGYGTDEHVTMAGGVRAIVEGSGYEFQPLDREVVWFGNFDEPVEPGDPRHGAAAELLVELFIRHSLAAVVGGFAVEEGYPPHRAASVGA